MSRVRSIPFDVDAGRNGALVAGKTYFYRVAATTAEGELGEGRWRRFVVEAPGPKGPVVSLSHSAGVLGDALTYGGWLYFGKTAVPLPTADHLEAELDVVSGDNIVIDWRQPNGKRIRLARSYPASLQPKIDSEEPAATMPARSKYRAFKPKANALIVGSRPGELTTGTMTPAWLVASVFSAEQRRARAELFATAADPTFKASVRGPEGVDAVAGFSMAQPDRVGPPTAPARREQPTGPARRVQSTGKPHLFEPSGPRLRRFRPSGPVATTVEAAGATPTAPANTSGAGVAVISVPAASLAPEPDNAAPLPNVAAADFVVRLPKEGVLPRGPRLVVRGRSRPGNRIDINGVVPTLDAAGRFFVVLTAKPEPFTVTVTSVDPDGNAARLVRHLSPPKPAAR